MIYTSGKVVDRVMDSVESNQTIDSGYRLPEWRDGSDRKIWITQPQNEGVCPPVALSPVRSRSGNNETLGYYLPLRLLPVKDSVGLFALF